MNRTEAECEYFDLLAALDRFPWIKLPHHCMKECGPAAQSLGGLLRITNRQTFVSVERIAESAFVPVASCRKHLKALHDAGYIKRQGRQRTPAGVLRRTGTIQVTAKGKGCDRFGILPSWLELAFPRRNVPWSCRAVFSLVMARMLSVHRGIEDDMRPDDLGCLYEKAPDRFGFSLSSIEEATGLSRPSIISAKSRLQFAGLIEWRSGEFEYSPDDLIPSLNAAIKSWNENGSGWYSVEAGR